MSADRARLRLLALVAELGDEVDRVTRTVDEITAAGAVLDAAPDDRLALYGSAALLETFYTGVEKALQRVARHFEGLPVGDSWHRELLATMALDIPGVRPAVLQRGTAAELDRFLSFRHRFRNLYLFDLETSPVRALLGAAPRTWSMARADLVGFAATLGGLAGG